MAPIYVGLGFVFLMGFIVGILFERNRNKANPAVSLKAVFGPEKDITSKKE